MRLLWTFLKVVIALALIVPVSIIVLATALGILGAVFGIAIIALKVGILALIGVGAFRLVSHLLGGAPKKARTSTSEDPLLRDPHYQAAMRELDRELGNVPR